MPGHQRVFNKDWKWSRSVVSNSFAISWTVALQAPLSMGLPMQEYWSGLPLPSLGDLPDPGKEIWTSRIARRFFTIWATNDNTFLRGSACFCCMTPCLSLLDFCHPEKTAVLDYSRGNFQLTVGLGKPRSVKGKECWQADFSAWWWGCLGGYTTGPLAPLGKNSAKVLGKNTGWGWEKIST